MNIIKFGGSVVNPDGKYDEKVIQDFINLVKESREKFIFVVGGGKICRKVQGAAKGFLKEALRKGGAVGYGNDWLGIACTKINANYVLEKFKEKLGGEVYEEIILDPTRKVKSKCRVFFTGGWKPGCSTDKDMMLLAEAYGAKKIFKISDFEMVKKIKPLELMKFSGKEKEKRLDEAEEIKEMSWSELVGLVGDKWVPGLNTPFDPEAAKIGFKLRKKLRLYILRKGELRKGLSGEEFRGTLVKD